MVCINQPFDTSQHQAFRCKECAHAATVAAAQNSPTTTPSPSPHPSTSSPLPQCPPSIPAAHSTTAPVLLTRLYTSGRYVTAIALSVGRSRSFAVHARAATGSQKTPENDWAWGCSKTRTNRDRGADRMQVLPVPLPLPLPPIYEKAELYLVRNHTLSRARTHVAHAQRTGWPSFREMATFRSRCLFVLRSAYHSPTEWA